MRFKMNRLSRAIKRGLISTEGQPKKQLISSLLGSQRLMLLAVGGASISACFVNSCIKEVDQYLPPSRPLLSSSADPVCFRGIDAQMVGVRQRL